MQSGHEIAVVLAGLKLRGWGAIAPECIVDFGETCVAAFRQVEFLQEIANPTITIFTGHHTLFLQVYIGDGRHRAFHVIYLYLVRIDVDFYRCALVPRLVINSIGHHLFYGSERIVEHTQGLCLSVDFHNLFYDNLRPKIVQCLTELFMYGATKYLLFKHCTHIVTKANNLNMGTRYIFLWIVTKEEQSDALRADIFRSAADNLHVPA